MFYRKYLLKHADLNIYFLCQFETNNNVRAIVSINLVVKIEMAAKKDKGKKKKLSKC